MILIVGLGNPGKEYEGSRHNVGWFVLDGFVEHEGLPKPTQSGKYAGMMSSGVFSQKDIDVLYPTTFMNHSGSAIKKYIGEKGKPEMLIAVHDEIDLPFGEVRISYDRGPGGHNGVKSLIDAIGSEFVRVRIGVAQKNLFGIVKRPKGDALSKFVLGAFTSREVKELQKIVERARRAIELLVTKGVKDAMNQFLIMYEGRLN